LNVIHELGPGLFDASFRHLSGPGPVDRVLCFDRNNLLWKIVEEGLALPRCHELMGLPEEAEFIFAFTLCDEPCYLYLGLPLPEGNGLKYRDPYLFRSLQPAELAWASLLGLQLSAWYAHHRRCGMCGSVLAHMEDERALYCPGCEAVLYPQIAPAVIVAVTSGQKILLARSSARPGGWYSLISGYVDIGETLEAAVVREVQEEVGLSVHGIRYVVSQPWPLSASLMVGFVAEASEDQEIRVDGNEIAEAAWFTRDRLPDHPPLLGIAGELIERFRNGELC